MENFFKRIHLPVVGIMLGFATLGNILQDISPILKAICGIIALLIFVLVVAKFILQPKACKEELSNPIIASSFPAFDMGLMVLCTYLKSLAPGLANLAKGIWIAALLLHLVFLIYVTIKFLVPFDLKKIFASFFITYVGFVVASVTAPAFEMKALGRILFFVGLTAYFLVLVLFVLRLYRFPEMPEMAKPSCAIVAAPASLCLAAYLSSFENLMPVPALLLFVLALFMTSWGFFFMLRTNKKTFYPSYAGYSFPFVISALAMKKMAAFSATAFPSLTTLFSVLATLELIIAVLACLYTLLRYVLQITSSTKAQA